MQNPSSSVRDFGVKYRELLCIDQTCTLSSVFPGIPLSALQIMWAGTTTETFIERKLLEWIENLDDDEKDCRMDKSLLRQLQLIANQIIVKDSASILKEKLAAAGVFSPLLEKRINWLFKRVMGINISYDPPKQANPLFHGLVVLSRMTSCSERSLSPQSFFNFIQNQWDHLRYQNFNSKIVRLGAEESFDSAQKIIGEFQDLNIEIQIKILNEVEYPLFINILNGSYVKWSPDELVLFITNLEDKRIHWILISLDDVVIAAIRAKISLATEEALASFKKFIIRYQEIFYSINNEMVKPQIDAFSKLLRHITLNEIDSSHLLTIENLTQEIKSQVTAIERFERIIRNIDPSVAARLTDIYQEYTRFALRVSLNSRDVKEPSSFYKAIYELSYDDLEDTDEAWEAIMTKWNIVDAEDFVLLGLFTPEELIHNPKPSFSLIRDLIAAYGLDTVGRLKQLKILNKYFLRDYITKIKAENTTTLTPSDAAKPC